MSSIEKYALKDGSVRWQVRYRDLDGRQRKSKGHTTKREASLFAAKLDVDQAKGSWIDPQAGKVTVGALWSSTPSAHLKQSTKANREIVWSTHVEPKWGKAEVGKIRPSHVRSWVAELSAAGLAPATVSKALGVLRTTLAVAVDDGLVASNPAAGVKPPRRDHTPRGYLTHQQVEQLAVACGDDGKLVRFLAYTGLRFGEAVGLQVGDFDMLRRRFTISRSITDVNGEMVTSTPKTGERRTVVFPAFLTDELAALMVGKTREQHLFTAPEGGLLRGRNWRRRRFDRAVEQCREADPEFPKITPHALRHTAASLAISAGANVKAVQTMLGHASAAMTLDTYADLFPSDVEAVAGALDAARSTQLGACALSAPSNL